MNDDEKARLRELARERVRGLLAKPRVSALSSLPERVPEPPAMQVAVKVPVLSPADRGWDLHLLNSTIEEVLDGGDILVTSVASAAPLAYAAREMEEEILASILERMPGLHCGSLSDFRTVVSDGDARVERLDWQFVTSHVVMQRRGAGLRVRSNHDLDDIAAILNKHDEVVFTSEERLRSALQQARSENFEALEKLFADMLGVGVLSISAMKVEAGLERFPGLRNRSTADLLVALAPELGSADDVMAQGRWRRE